MNAVHVALFIVVMMLGARLLDLKRNPGYRCPACGTSNAREHHEDCAWRKHYGEDL